MSIGEMVGLAGLLISLIGSLVAVVTKNTTVNQKLIAAVDRLTYQLDESKADRARIHEELDDHCDTLNSHETRITVLEKTKEK
jgi:hypothetical protein